ncbi:IS110 family transposase [Pseudomonas yamanorum]|uniref:IS110 family transposase n=1 Tax=Pseudomonas yamanorum TaxID=515393 RepID=A0A7Y8FEB6_9PSED|nr:IS110 family transposase [Pseudomonas yamanorum]
MDKEVEELEAQIKVRHRANETSRELERIPDSGPLTSSELVASLGDAKNFSNGRQLAAWLGLVPPQNSSGGRPTWLGMSKRGDAHLRTLMIHGSRSVIYRAGQKNDPDS